MTSDTVKSMSSGPFTVWEVPDLSAPLPSAVCRWRANVEKVHDERHLANLTNQLNLAYSGKLPPSTDIHPMAVGDSRPNLTRRDPVSRATGLITQPSRRLARTYGGELA